MNRSQLLREPLQSDPWARWAEQLLDEGRQEAAIRAYRIACSYSKAHLYALSQALLLNSEIRAGFQLHEHRPWMPWFAWLEQKLGPANLSSDQVLLISEQGLGDTLHFLRYAEWLQLQGKRVLLLCQPQLVELIQQLTPITDVEAFWDPTTPEPPDQQMQRRWPELAARLGLNTAWSWAPLMSLAHLLGHGAHLPLQQGMVCNEALQQRSEQWRTQLRCRPGHRLIGLTWQGNAAVEHLPALHGRSLPFSAWLDLLPHLQRAGPMEFVILQKGLQNLSAQADLPLVRGQEHYLPVQNFIDTAAVVRCCDLVLSCDTVIGHLAGNLRVPCWLALKRVPDWRWGLKGDLTPLYPSLKLFRQGTTRTWDSVVQQIGAALAQPSS